MTAPDAARPAESVEDVLAAHRFQGFLTRVEVRDGVRYESNFVQATCSCGETWPTAEGYDAHLAAALAEAGIGSLAQARAEGARAVVEAVESFADKFGATPDYSMSHANVAQSLRAAARAAAQQVKP